MVHKHFKEIIKDDLHLSRKDLDDKHRVASLLVSYYYFHRKIDLERIHAKCPGQNVDLMMDSGVFTYRKQGADVDIDKYINFLNDGADYINSAVTLDYPHDAKSIMKNTYYIKERLDPRITLVPVVQTFIFNREETEQIMNDFDFICLGTYDGEHKSIMYSKEVQESLKVPYELNKKYNKILHGLGRTKFSWLDKNPVESSDSSSWARYIFTGNTTAWDARNKDVVNYADKGERFRLMAFEDYYCDRFNITTDEYDTLISHRHVLHAESFPHNAMCSLAYKLMEEEVRKKKPNYRCYLATSNSDNFKSVSKALDLFYNRKH